MVAPTSAALRQAPARPMFDLHGKSALVTGGSRGIGRGIALALARAGANVAINFAAHKEAADEVAHAVADLGARCRVVAGDVSAHHDAERMVDAAAQEFGKVDILVNNAGILTSEPFLEMKEATWDRLLAVNLKGQFLVAQAAARHMVAEGTKGRIINVASIASGQVGIGFPGIAHYVASKGGVVALTEAMAIELAPYGITVNAVAPGLVDTDMTAGMGPALLPRIPLGRAGTPADIGAMATFLASDEASYCTGATFYVDGGWLAG